MVIEDDKKIAGAIQRVLLQEDFVVDVCMDGISGYDLAAGEEYDLIVLDRLLPGIGGVEVCARLRKENICTPILMLTAKRQLQDKVEGLDAGADDYLVKPFAFEELLARIRALARRPRESIGQTLEVDDLVLYRKTREVKRGESSIAFLAKEYLLLEYLLQHKNQVISKDQIISHVWGYEDTIVYNTVESYIAHLRKKIDKDFPHRPQLIHTVKGFGYRIGEK